jgi:hypothetical protein
VNYNSIQIPTLFGALDPDLGRLLGLEQFASERTLAAVLLARLEDLQRPLYPALDREELKLLEDLLQGKRWSAWVRCVDLACMRLNRFQRLLDQRGRFVLHVNSALISYSTLNIPHIFLL